MKARGLQPHFAQAMRVPLCDGVQLLCCTGMRAFVGCSRHASASQKLTRFSNGAKVEAGEAGSAASPARLSTSVRFVSTGRGGGNHLRRLACAGGCRLANLPPSVDGTRQCGARLSTLSRSLVGA